MHHYSNTKNVKFVGINLMKSENGIYTSSYKTLLRETEPHLSEEIKSLIVTQYHKNVSSLQVYLQIECNSNYSLDFFH